MKIFVVSSIIAIVIAVIAYNILMGSGMDTASVMAGANVRL